MTGRPTGVGATTAATTWDAGCAGSAADRTAADGRAGSGVVDGRAGAGAAPAVVASAGPGTGAADTMDTGLLSACSGTSIPRATGTTTAADMAAVWRSTVARRWTRRRRESSHRMTRSIAARSLARTRCRRT